MEDLGKVDVFISYSSKNKTVADAVVSDFEQNGIRCWYAPRDILPGQEWVTAIQEGIRSAKVFILLFTDESNASRQVMNEVALAFNAEKTIVPFKLTKQEMSDELGYYLTRVHWLDAVSQPLSDHIEELRRYVEIILSGTKPKAAEEQRTASHRIFLIAGIVAVLAIAGILVWVLKPFGLGGKKPGTNNGTVEQEQKAYAELLKQGDAYYQQGDHKNALDSYLKSLENGNTETATYYRIAEIYLAGKAGVEVDEEKGLSYLELAYNDGNGEKLTADEFYKLAYKYDSDAETRDPKKVCAFARAGAEAGSVQCMLLLGEVYWYGNGVEQDYGQVVTWFGAALDSGLEGYKREYCISCITTLVEEGHVSREAASKWLPDND